MSEAGIHTAGALGKCTCEAKVETEQRPSCIHPPPSRVLKRVRFSMAKNETWVIPRKLADEYTWGSWHLNLPSYATGIVSTTAEAEALAMIDSLTECIISSLDTAESDKEEENTCSIDALLDSIDPLPMFSVAGSKNTANCPGHKHSIATDVTASPAKRRRLSAGPLTAPRRDAHLNRTPLAEITAGCKLVAMPSS